MASRAESAVLTLSFYDHRRQSYGHLPLHNTDAYAQFMVGDFGEPGEPGYGVGEGGEFAIELYQFGRAIPAHGDSYLAPRLQAFYDATKSLKQFLASGAWDLIAKSAREKAIHTSDDLTALLLGAGLHDRSEHPVGHKPVCDCCGRPVDG